MSNRWAFMERHDIMDLEHPDRVYLRRLRVIETPLFGVLLHSIKLPDTSRHYHSHPWPFVSVVLRGQYTETRPTPWSPRWETYSSFFIEGGGVSFWTRLREMVNVSPRGRMHKIEWISGRNPWTLVVHGRRSRQGWGFMVNGEIVSNDRYVKEGLWRSK